VPPPLLLQLLASPTAALGGGRAGGGGWLGGGSRASRAGAAAASSAGGAATPMPRGARPACLICFELPGDAVFMECGHAGVCGSCARAITHGHVDEGSGEVCAGSGTCPMCRAPVLQVLRLGPDAASLDGRTVAMVAPACYWRVGRGEGGGGEG
jgi:hypothetical protein